MVPDENKLNHVSGTAPPGSLNKNYRTKRHRAILLFECEEWENVSLWKFGWVAGAQMSSRVGDDSCTFQFRWKKNWVYSFKLIPHFYVKYFRWSRNIGPHKQRSREVALWADLDLQELLLALLARIGVLIRGDPNFGRGLNIWAAHHWLIGSNFSPFSPRWSSPLISLCLTSIIFFS